MLQNQRSYVADIIPLLRIGSMSGKLTFFIEVTDVWQTLLNKHII